MDAINRSPGSPENTDVRDRLALIRTVLANERTFLAYLRTSLALLATGFSAIHFLPGQGATWSGAVLVMLGFICVCLGAVRFRTVHRTIRREERE